LYGETSDITLKPLRQEVCGDDSFRSKFQDYTKNSGSALNHLQPVASKAIALSIVFNPNGRCLSGRVS
jgi:hypothetical protein